MTADTRKIVEDNESYQLRAVVDVGSTSIRMVVAQVRADGMFEYLDTLSQSVAIGSDTFTRGRISTGTTEECVKVLRNFLTVLREYRMDLGRQVRAVATSAVREARNREAFLDRLYMATGIDVQVIEGTEVNRLTYLGIQPLLAQHKPLQQDHLLVVEVGGGSTEMLGLENGRVAFAHTYRMGSYRIRETIDALNLSDLRQNEVLEMEIQSGVRQCRRAVGSSGKKLSLLLIGGEARLAAKILLKDWDETQLGQLKVAELAALANEVLSHDVEWVAKQYHLPFEGAQTLGPALQICVRLAKEFGVKRVYVCGVTLRDGLVAEAARGTAWTDDFIEQILHSIREIGRRYGLDRKHADCVTNHALALFRALRDEHRLGIRYEVVLTVAAQLHDVGSFIGNSSHHKHSKYIIENSDIFGLGKEDIKLAGLVARYHRRAAPRESHADYSGLPRAQRLVVNQLAAILRIADALDRNHSQSMRHLTIRLEEGRLLLEDERGGNFTAEKRALAAKGKMFEQVYGRAVVLRTKRK